MTRWNAMTNFNTIGSGTTLCLYLNGHISGTPKPPIEPGPLNIEMADNRRITAQLVEATCTNVVLEVDGKQWTLTPRQDGELGSNINTSLYSEDWIVRREI